MRSGRNAGALIVCDPLGRGKKNSGNAGGLILCDPLGCPMRIQEVGLASSAQHQGDAPASSLGHVSMGTEQCAVVIFSGPTCSLGRQQGTDPGSRVTRVPG